MYIRSFLNCLSAHFHTYECMSNTLSTGTPRFCWRILMWWTVWDDWPRCSCSISSCSYASAATILTSLMELSQVCARERKEGGREGEERLLSEWLSVLLSVCVHFNSFQVLPTLPTLTWFKTAARCVFWRSFFLDCMRMVPVYSSSARWHACWTSWRTTVSGKSFHTAGWTDRLHTLTDRYALVLLCRCPIKVYVQ